MTGINRAAWKRIKERVANPQPVAFFKGRSVGATMGVLEDLQRFELEKVFAPDLALSRELALIEMHVRAHEPPLPMIIHKEID